METIFVIGCKPKDEGRIKSLLKKSYQVDTCSSVHHSLDILAKKKFSLVLYDSDNVYPIDLFMRDLKGKRITPRVSAMTSRTGTKYIKQLISSGVISIIKKPFTKPVLIKGIKKGLVKEEQAKAQPRYVLKKNEAEILIGLKKHAIITGIAKTHVSMLLPTGLSKKTTVMLGNHEFFDLIGLEYYVPPKIRLVSKKCDAIGDHQFQVAFEYSEPLQTNIRKCIDKYVDEHRSSRKNRSEIKSILVVDTDIFTHDFYRICLMEKGYDLLAATDASEAIEVIENDDVDLIIMDISLREDSGTQLIEALKENKIKIPIIVATGESNPQIQRRLSAQVQDYLLKPLKKKTLVNSVSKIAKKHKKSVGKVKDPSAVGVYLETNVMVAFRDHIRLNKIISREIEISRKNPIAPGTTIFLKTDAIKTPRQESHHGNQSFELFVIYCEKKAKRGYFTMRARIRCIHKSG